MQTGLISPLSREAVLWDTGGGKGPQHRPHWEFTGKGGCTPGSLLRGEEHFLFGQGAGGRVNDSGVSDSTPEGLHFPNPTACSGAGWGV